MKRTVELGKLQDGRPLCMDIPKLVQTRLSLFASSGAGKTYALLKILEATRGLLPQLVFDLEGDFTPLRRKASYNYVLASPKGGDIVAHPSTAAVLARHFMERNFSLLVDMYEMDVQVQRRFVRLFVEAMLAAPRKLWRPRLILADECQELAPEKGGDSAESLPAMIRLSKKGRKRGLTLITATQRPADISKALTSQLGNKLIGAAYTDIDQDRAARELRIRNQATADTLAHLDPGHFYAVGPALGRELKVVHMGMPADRPDEGGKTVLRRPPAPGPKLKGILASLSTLPKEAEEEARTAEELRAKVRGLEADLRKATAPIRTFNIDKLTDAQLKELKEAFARRNYAAATIVANVNGPDTKAAVDKARKEERANYEQLWRKEIERTKAIVVKVIESHANKAIIELREGLKARMPKEITVPPVHQHLQIKAAHVNTAPPAKKTVLAFQGEEIPLHPMSGCDDRKLGACEQNILDFLALRGREGRVTSKIQLAVGAGKGYAVSSGGFRNAIGALKTRGLITGNGDGPYRITDAHQDNTNLPGPSKDRWLANSGAAEKKILASLVVGMTKAEIAAACGYAATSGGFRNAIGRLRSLGLIKFDGDGIQWGKEVMP